MRQVMAMTDDTGIFQHARFGTPDLHHGYCIDDNARALIAAVQSSILPPITSGWDNAKSTTRYLRFVAYALNPETRRFRNFMGYDRCWLEKEGSHDSQGRAFWSLGVTLQRAPAAHHRHLAKALMDESLAGLMTLNSLRTMAFVLLGLDAGIEALARPDDRWSAGFKTLSDRISAVYRRFSSADWPWWEPTVTYDNARLPQALLAAGKRLEDHDLIEGGLASLAWLIEIQTNQEEGHLSIIGNDGWMNQDGTHAQFDQQPLEALGLVEACLLAYKITSDEKWVGSAHQAFGWFTGKNDLGITLIEEDTGGCRDGLTPHGVNQNQGAESILAYVLACQAMRLES